MNRTAILIGNKTFLPSSGLMPLAGPQNDVDSLAELLADDARGNFQVTTFIDESSYEIQPKIEKVLRKARLGDTVLIFYAGHGKLDGIGGLCLATSNTTDLYYSTSITASHLAGLVAQSKCQCVILILDCCYSGAFSRELFRGDDAESHLTQLVQSSGLYVFTASKSTEVARELELSRHGIAMGKFTNAIVNGIRTGKADGHKREMIFLSDLVDYVGDNVEGQTPQYFSKGGDGNGPLISLVAPPDPLAERRKALLGSWFSSNQLTPDLHGWLLRTAEGKNRKDWVEFVRAQLDDPATTPEGVRHSLRRTASASAQSYAPRQPVAVPSEPKGSFWGPLVIAGVILSALACIVLFIGWIVVVSQPTEPVEAPVATSAAEVATPEMEQVPASTPAAVPSVDPQPVPIAAEVSKPDEMPCQTQDDDGDGVNNCLDRCSGSGAGQTIDGNGCSVQPDIELKGVNFTGREAELRPDAKAILSEAAEILDSYPHLRVQIAGYTDSSGTQAENLALSRTRASKVYEHLIELGVRKSQLLTPKAYGELDPVVPKENADGSENAADQEANNRVELITT